MLVSFYHMTLKLLKHHIFWCKNIKILPSFTQRFSDVITERYEICQPLVVYRVYCMAFYHYRRDFV